jgi:glycosyltransferase involved in cell wall biosynthesis
VRKLLQEEKIELVHAHGTRAGSNILWAARSLKIPVIYTVHGWSFHQDQHPLVRRIRILGEKYLTSRSDINISVSASNKQSGKNYIHNFESVVINNGIDQNRFSVKVQTTDVRKALGIPAEVLLVLFIARFTSHKQPLALIRAFHAALPEIPGMHLLMVGDGDQKAEALRLVKELNIADRVVFEQFRQDVPDVLAAADIFVLPSLWEGLPIGLLEAMAMGKAVIATNVDGTSEVVQDNMNGLLIEAGNIQALTQAIIRMGKDHALRTRFGQKALETIQLKYNAAHMTRKIEKVYLGLLNKDKKFSDLTN